MNATAATTCQTPGCTTAATYLINGVAYCNLDAAGFAAHAQTWERIAPNPPAPANTRPACHYCGLPLTRGQCEECQ